MLVWIGDRSYSIYLYHLPVLFVFKTNSTTANTQYILFTAAILVIVFLSDFSYKYIEGSTLYQLNNREVYLNFLSWFENNFCQPSFSVKDVSTLSNDAITFYKDKTYLRFNLFKQKMEFAHYDSVTKINDVDVYPMQH